MFGEKQNMVGQFYERVGHAIVGGELVRNDDGDICLWKEDLTIEIKSSGFSSNYGFRLHVPQIEDYERMSMFPFKRAWYILFSYRNRCLAEDGGKRRNEMAKYQTVIDVNRYLAETTLWCTIVDLSIVSRWKERKVVSTRSVPGRPGARTVDVKCREIYRLTNGGFNDTLRELELDSSRFRLLTGTVTLAFAPDLLEKYHLKFPLNVVIPWEEVPLAKKFLRRRGFRLREAQDDPRGPLV